MDDEPSSLAAEYAVEVEVLDEPSHRVRRKRLLFGCLPSSSSGRTSFFTDRIPSLFLDGA